LVQIGEPMIDLLAPGMPALRGVSAAAVPIEAPVMARPTASATIFDEEPMTFLLSCVLR
jgi:hypothetical protein